ncbi:MAG: Asp-tRNA(Asn)/Glu-tRNA(Gln) amidotransferase subunit GatB, partial [Aeoliella sp.]
GKSLHDELAGRSDSLIDLNRTGTPLLEIVSEPDMRGALESRAYLDELKLLLTYIGVSDCNMQEGSLRVDANVNLHIDANGEKVATPIVEIKNMNSFRAVERAIEYEAGRQWNVWQETGQVLGAVPKQTRGWDDDAGVTRGQRSKEESSDYRYFPDPDLVPVVFSESEIKAARASLGDLPAALRSQLRDDFGLSLYDAQVLVNQGRELVDYYLAALAKASDAKAVCNWVSQDVLRVMKEREITIKEFPISSDQLADLVIKLKSGDLPSSRGRDVFDLMLAEQLSVEQSMEQLGIEEVDETALVELCRELLEANPRIVADLKAGKQQAIGAIIGQAKKKNPNVDPGRIREISLELIAKPL